MFLCSLRYCLKLYFSKGVYSFTLSTVYIYIYIYICLYILYVCVYIYNIYLVCLLFLECRGPTILFTWICIGIMYIKLISTGVAWHSTCVRMERCVFFSTVFTTSFFTFTSLWGKTALPCHARIGPAYWKPESWWLWEVFYTAGSYENIVFDVVLQ